MQHLIVALILVVALAYVVRKLFNSFRPGASSCGCGCSGCSTAGCLTPPEKKQKHDQ